MLRHLHDDVAVVGWACRLPGANSVEALWSLLLEGKCSVSRVPEDRFPAALFEHPRRQERGRSVTFAAGVIDGVWDFDPGVFGIAPREAAQMDPQQRILLQLTWEALENAGIRPSSIAGTEVGVFVGASNVEYANALYADPAAADAHFAPGNALSTISNRISYIFNLQGPSFTVDTACSSSLVALHQALEALRAGRIDTAIVGGINVIASPFTFISFSQASMLSPSGLCRAFSAEADGFVRAEGGVVLVLRKSAHAAVEKNPCHAVLLGSDLNSDGRTNGISLPSSVLQKSLLERVYARANINLSNLAFIEAHGTGTPIGDPIEAMAIGEGLARKRTEPIPIGSIKTNIGHLEAASGMAGMLKAMLALQHGVFPRSLHCERPNPAIDFKALNLRVCDQPLLLKSDATQCAGVSSFGFGGTNAHVIVGPGRSAPAVKHTAPSSGAEMLTISAASQRSLSALAQDYVEQMHGLAAADLAAVAGAAAHRRDPLRYRAVVATLEKPAVLRALTALASDGSDPHLTTGEAIGSDLPVAFVYSGNGTQWNGMGRAAYRANTRFRDHFDEVDRHFSVLAGWSLKQMMFDAEAGDRLNQTSVAQPLIFAIQSAATAALRERGLIPSAVVGHSVGEIAAAQSAGILDLRGAVNLVYYRSLHQETTRETGKMVALVAPPERATELISAIEGLEIAAYNAPNAVTVAGPAEAVSQLQLAARAARIPLVDLNLDYPFHSRLIDPIKAPLLRDIADLRPRDSTVPFISSVTGLCMPGERLDSVYWWRNIRQPVRFVDAVREVARLGARCFVEIGPRGTLAKHVQSCLEGANYPFITLNVLDRDETEGDPFAKSVARALIAGAKVDTDTVFPGDPGARISLPTYPWQQESFRLEKTPEALGFAADGIHPFRAFRVSEDGLEWRCFLDTEVMPLLADHRVGDQTIFPATGFLELALLAGRQFLRSDKISISHLEIMRPLDLTAGKTREVMTRISASSSTIEILSRPRLTESNWQLHCRGKLAPGTPPRTEAMSAAGGRGVRTGNDRVYELADASGLHYGPAFRLTRGIRKWRDREIEVRLEPATGPAQYLLDPMRLDACVHGIVTLFPRLNAIERGVTYIPVRLDKVVLYAGHRLPASARLRILGRNERSIVIDFDIYDQNGQLIASLFGMRAQAIGVHRRAHYETIALLEHRRPADGALAENTGVALMPSEIVAEAVSSDSILDRPRHSDAHQLLQTWATVVAYRIISAIPHGERLDLDALALTGRIDARAVAWLTILLRRLATAGLAEYDGHQWKLSRNEPLPEAAGLVRELSDQHPELAGELLVAGEATGRVEKLFAKGRLPADGLVSDATREFRRISSIALKSAVDRLVDQIQVLLRTQDRQRTLRVLQVGHNTLTFRLSALFRHLQVSHTVFEPVEATHEEAKADLQYCREIELLARDRPLQPESFDLIVSAFGLGTVAREQKLAGLNHALARNGVIVAVEPQPALIHDLLAEYDRLDSDDVADGGSLLGMQGWKEVLARAGYADASTHLVDCVSGNGILIVAGKGEQFPGKSESADPSLAASRPMIVLPDKSHHGRSKEILRALRRFVASYSAISQTESHAGISPNAEVTRAHSPVTHGDGASDRLSARCLSLKASLDRIGSTATPVWLIFFGALPSGSGEIDPVEAGAWAFARVATNEYAGLDIRRVDVARGITPEEAVERLRRIIAAGSDETELQIDIGVTSVVRVGYVSEQASAADDSVTCAQLQKNQNSAQRVGWTAVARHVPKPAHIEVRVAATGLNFRDLMWSLGLLPDEILEGGYTGPTLGLECAGEVSQVGDAVTGFKKGDRVVAFAPSAFSTHVTLPAAQVIKIPDGMTFEAAATIPVAFLTAYYGLVTLAKLKRREWVLIHAAAGGVGMAAIQIAQRQGARIIGTAGSEAKREMLRALGVEHVLDSRSNSLVDDVRAITGAGVDVVLNSLAGELMEMSIECLRPFGRFLELGKRDYVGNTHVGLRPFHKNLSYFGVDVDQLLLKNRNYAGRLFGKLMSRFEAGVYRALPHSVFSADEVSRAFRVMQKSQHVGKIVVTPPALENVVRLPRALKINAKGSHIITGAFGGFGLEAANWLVERGARSLVMIGRSGAASTEAKETLKKFRKRGIRVLEAAVDVSDADAMDSLFAKIGKSMPPVCGVIHAAMVLDDALIANLDAAKFNRVLKPKIEGAEHLDRLTRKLTLDYFVLFSSVASMLGNPGQGNYVAANAYMEALARRRRQSGLPALAIGWGPISDVGVFARSERAQANISDRLRLRGMTAREALGHMATAIEQSQMPGGYSVVTITGQDRRLTKDRLRILRSPTFKTLAGTLESEEAATEIDLAALIQREGPETARKKVAALIVSQVAKVLRFRESEVNQTRPLGEIGLDSLMALELALDLESLFNVHGPFSAPTSELTIARIADEIVAQAQTGALDDRKIVHRPGHDDPDPPSREPVAAAIVAKHIVSAEEDQMTLLDRIASEPRRQTRLLS